jgi:hypothetical protein
MTTKYDTNIKYLMAGMNHQKDIFLQTHDQEEFAEFAEKEFQNGAWVIDENTRFDARFEIRDKKGGFYLWFDLDQCPSFVECVIFLFKVLEHFGMQEPPIEDGRSYAIAYLKENLTPEFFKEMGLDQ